MKPRRMNEPENQEACVFVFSFSVRLDDQDELRIPPIHTTINCFKIISSKERDCTPILSYAFHGTPINDSLVALQRSVSSTCPSHSRSHCHHAYARLFSCSRSQGSAYLAQLHLPHKPLIHSRALTRRMPVSSILTLAFTVTRCIRRHTLSQ